MEAKVSSILEKNNNIRKNMLLKSTENSFKSRIFYIDKSEYQDTFEKNNELETIAEAMYLNSLSLNQYVETDRHLSERYLTPELSSFYGSSLKIDGQMGYYVPTYAHNSNYVNSTGRLPDNFLGIDIKIEDVYNSFDEIKNNGGVYYLKQCFENQEKLLPDEGKYKSTSIYTPEKDKGYVYANVNMETGIAPVILNKTSEISKAGEKSNYLTPEYDESYYNEKTLYDTQNIESCDLLGKTKKLFRDNRISTIRRFYKGNGAKVPKKGNDADDVYVRQWNQVKQYSTVNDLMRPFKDDNGSRMTISDIQKMNSRFRTGIIVKDETKNETEEVYLSQNTVLNNNGFVNITPVKTSGNNADVKKCMFSIENLAWKDVPDKQEYWQNEQRGPNGGRIMWFPPYDLSFDENVRVEWPNNTFIGRGEPVYTYGNTTRTGTIKFSILIDHPNILNYVNEMDQTDIDNDIYRFFMGEQLLNIKETEIQNKKDEKPKEEPIEDKLVPNEESVEIKFNIYFPPNYSGLSHKISKNQWEQGNYDEDWFIYMLIGQNTLVSGWEGEAITTDEWRGYEIRTDGAGITRAKYGISSDYLAYGNECIPWKESNQYKFKGEADGITDDSKFIGVNGTRVEASEANINDIYVTYVPSLYPELEEEEHHYYYSNGKLWKSAPYYNYRTDFDMSPLQTKGGDTIGGGYYSNGASSGYNSYGLENVIYGEETNNFTFAQIASATIPEDNKQYENIKEYLRGQGIYEDSEEVLYLSRLLANRENITSISVSGSASIYEGGDYETKSKDNAEIIAQRRAKTCAKFFKNYLNVEDVKEDSFDVKDGEKFKKEDCYAEVVIKVKTSDIQSFENTGNGVNSDALGDSLNIAEKVNFEVTDENSDSQVSDETVVTVTTPYIGNRYENEADYFNKLESNDPLVFKNIHEKFKYFNPAFHSISPEGFNARLTFLHQCTRQGHTIEASDKNYGEIAGNLAFGRMPVCVLRLGDFLNTRILIESMSISYDKDGMQWDLNPEGAGVQPMFATVSLGIVILGGQSLTGPVSRLQNALTFDYYANAGVYDDRADIVKLGNGQGKYDESFDRLWTPYPDKK